MNDMFGIESNDAALYNPFGVDAAVGRLPGVAAKAATPGYLTEALWANRPAN